MIAPINVVRRRRKRADSSEGVPCGGASVFAAAVSHTFDGVLGRLNHFIDRQEVVFNGVLIHNRISSQTDKVSAQTLSVELHVP